jgi:hypothetical protein
MENLTEESAALLNAGIAANPTTVDGAFALAYMEDVDSGVVPDFNNWRHDPDVVVCDCGHHEKWTLSQQGRWCSDCQENYEEWRLDMARHDWECRNDGGY